VEGRKPSGAGVLPGGGVRESAFYFWRRKLTHCGERADAENGSRSQGPMPRGLPPSSRGRSRENQAPSFLPVRMAEAGVAKAAYGIEIVMAQGRTVRVPAGFDRQTLAEVLAVLEDRPC
jgi:hypothetical protein